MTRTLNLTGFQTGDNLSLSVSQGALTAGPVNVPSWGGPTGGGTISINVHRTIYQVAPDSVRFTVDLDESDFDTPGPVDEEIYDARMHDLIYLWDFDDAASGDWTAPINLLPEWKNRNVAKGPFVAHMYTQPGTYNPSVMIIEPSSGKIAQASLEIVVADPDVIYGGSGTYPDTICINPVGDSDFSAKPVANAQEVNVDLIDDADQWWSNQHGDHRPKRILLKRGTSCDCKLDLGTMHAGLYFGDYGAGAKPILNAVPSTVHSEGIMHSSGHYARNATLNLGPDDPGPDLRFSNLDFRGGLDPTVKFPTGDGSPDTVGCWLKRNIDWIISNCDFGGLTFAASQLPTTVSPAPGHFHFDNCTMTAFGGMYPIFINQNLNDVGSVAFTGCRFDQTPDAIDNDLIDDDDPEVGNTSYGTRAIVRSEWSKFNHVRGCDLYLTDSTQPPLKIVGKPYRDGAVVNIHSTSFEGGSYAVWMIGSEGLRRNTVYNVVMDGNIYVGAYGTSTFILTAASGTTVRNNLVIFPSVPKIGIANRSFVQILNQGGEYDSVIVGAAPVRVYNNTFVGLRTSVQNNSHDPVIVQDDTSGGFSAITVENNILHKPNQDVPAITYAPLATDILWAPRCRGYRDAGTKTLHVEYATPPDTVRSYRPDTGSPALGAALTGNVSYMDMTLRKRPEPPSIGAWEME